MPTKIAINGFGRIGRCMARILFTKDWDLELTAVNSRAGARVLAHLLKYDSVHGIFPGEVEAQGDKLAVNGKTVALPQMDAMPEELPWRDLGVQMVAECTGIFREREKAAGHIRAGAKKVVLSAPGKQMDASLVYGVNHQSYDPGKHDVVSNTSYTTNCLAPVVKVIHENFDLEHGLMTTAHSYTMTQRLLDGSSKDLRRGRAAARNIVPTTTGAATAVTEVIPELHGRLDGVALRVPTADGSIADLTAVVRKTTDKEKVNQAFEAAAAGALKGILAVSHEPLVSSD